LFASASFHVKAPIFISSKNVDVRTLGAVVALLVVTVLIGLVVRVETGVNCDDEVATLLGNCGVATDAVVDIVAAVEVTVVDCVATPVGTHAPIQSL
jgi:hypothetical protein